eukprot:6178291-Pleurochrysis_carterae.AAC.2
MPDSLNRLPDCVRAHQRTCKRLFNKSGNLRVVRCDSKKTEVNPSKAEWPLRSQRLSGRWPPLLCLRGL